MAMGAMVATALALGTAALGSTHFGRQFMGDVSSALGRQLIKNAKPKAKIAGRIHSGERCASSTNKLRGRIPKLPRPKGTSKYLGPCNPFNKQVSYDPNGGNLEYYQVRNPVLL